MDEQAFRLGGALEVGLGELEDELEEELEDELEELEKLKELEEDVGGDVVAVEGLWTFLGLSQPSLLKPLTAWGAGAFADLGGLPLFLLGLSGTWVGGTGVIMLVAAVALEALLGSLGFFLLGKVKPEKSTGAPLYMAGGGALSLTRRRLDLRTPLGIVAGVGLGATAWTGGALPRGGGMEGAFSSKDKGACEVLPFAPRFARRSASSLPGTPA